MAGSSTSNIRSYVDVAQAIQGHLRAGTYRPGSLLPTERELQGSFGVSRSTVRKALQHLVESGWAETIANRGVVGKVGRNDPSSNLIGFVDHASSVHQTVYFRLSAELEKRGYHLTFVDSKSRSDEGALEACVERGFAGAILWSKTATPDIARVERVASRLPIIAIEHSLPEIDTDVVGNDMYAASIQVISHLYQLGRRNVAFTGMLDGLDSSLSQFSGFIAGFFRAQNDGSFVPHPRNFLPSRTSGVNSDDFHLLSQRLNDPDRPDAIVVLQDMCMPAVLELLRRKGLRVPHDIAVVGFGNDVPVSLDEVGLTTVGYDWDTVSLHIANAIADRIENPHRPFQRISLPTRLIVRGSAGEPASEWSQVPFQPSRPDPVHYVIDLASAEPTASGAKIPVTTQR